MKTYLVTGGCGFVGVNLIPQLIGQGAQVRVLDDLSVGRREDVEPFGVEFQLADIRDATAVAKACAGIDVVVHLAAHTRVIDSISNPQLNFEINALGTLNVLRVCRDAGVQKVILASTGGAILGEQAPPVHEGMVPRPLSPYGASKLAAEAYCSAFYGSFGLKTIALRFSNVYGPYSYHKGSVVAQYFKSIIQKQPLVVYGDGEQTRDFIYVGDIVHAILLADAADIGGEVFQIASGRGTSVNTLISTMKKLIPDAPMDVQYEAARAGEIRHNYCSIEKARRILGYSPKVELEDGLKRTWAWFTAQQREATQLTSARLQLGQMSATSRA